MLIRSFEMVPGQSGIDFSAPGVDSATQTSDVFKTVPLKVSGSIQAAAALVIVDNEKILARSARQNLLHQFLSEEVRIWKPNCFPFFPGSHIEKVDRLTIGDAFGQFPWLDLHGDIGLVADDNVVDCFVDVEVLVARAYASESFIKTEAAAAATADVIFAKERPLRAWKLHQQIAHGNIWIDG